MVTDPVEPVAVVERSVQSHVEVYGVPVAYRRWSSGTDHTVIVLHGSGAHGLWFAGMVPHLTSLGQVVAIDFSGHGDSAWRAQYTPELWAAEVDAVLGAVGASTVSVVAHSMGGYVAAALLVNTAVAVTDVTIFDTRFRAKAGATPPPVRAGGSTLPTYPSFAHARSRFRYIPDQPDLNPELTDLVAREAIGVHPDGYGWKVDPATFGTFRGYPFDRALAQIHVPVTYVYGAQSDVCDATSAQHVVDHWAGPVTTGVIPGTYHHLVIDDPVRCAAFVAAQREQTRTTA